MLRSLGLEHVVDEFPGEGPLGGILTALSHGAPAVVLACDLPKVEVATCSRCIAPLAPRRRDRLHATAPSRCARSGHRRRFLCSEREFVAGERAMHRAIDGLDVAWVTVPSDDSQHQHACRPAKPLTWPGMTVSEVTVDELESALQSGAPLIDVRQPDEYEAGHVPGAVLVPLAMVPSTLDSFPVDKRAYVICRTGARSHRACEFLADQGPRRGQRRRRDDGLDHQRARTVDGDQPA